MNYRRNSRNWLGGLNRLSRRALNHLSVVLFSPHKSAEAPVYCPGVAPTSFFVIVLFANGDSGCSWRAFEELLLVDAAIHHNIEEANHHLFPALFAVANFGRRVGIGRIIRRVVE